MKKIFALLCILFLSAGMCFADDYVEEADDYDDGYVYDSNGAGDQFLKIGLMPLFPLNFNGKLHIGGAAELGYYKFLNKYIALGGEASASFNVTIGKNALTMVPFTFGVLVQPSAGSFEFPISVGAGFGYTSCANEAYFPGLVVNAEAGAFYRFSEIWSFGLSGKFTWVPQWFIDSSKNANGLFAGAVVYARYHF